MDKTPQRAPQIPDEPRHHNTFVTQEDVFMFEELDLKISPETKTEAPGTGRTCCSCHCPTSETSSYWCC